jgi:hypothetical protein
VVDWDLRRLNRSDRPLLTPKSRTMVTLVVVDAILGDSGRAFSVRRHYF